MIRFGKFSKSLNSALLILFFALLAQPAWADKSLDDRKKAAMALVSRYETSNGCCPSVSCSGTLCSIICCPCCIPCIAEAIVVEVCSLPSTRVARTKTAARQKLLDWRNAVIQSRSTDEKNEYNEFVRTHARAVSPHHSTPLFADDADMTVFLIQEDVQNSIPPQEQMRILEIP